jgi:hypothetical protein
VENAVWVYMNDSLRTDRNFDGFIDWAKGKNVRLVILYFPKDELYPAGQAAPEMAAFVERCKGEGLEVHGMVSGFMSPPKEFFEPGYEQCFAVDWHGCSSRFHPAGGNRHFLDPNQALVIEMLCTAVANLLDAYPSLDGVQLDFVRYFHSTTVLTVDTAEAGSDLRLLVQDKLKVSGERGEAVYFLDSSSVKLNDPPIGGVQQYYHYYHYCFCDKCLTDFNATYGIPVSLDRPRAEVAREIATGHAAQWHAFRAEVITRAVKAVRETVNQVAAGKRLSATIWYNSPYGNRLTGKPFRPGSEYTDFGQAWEEWAAQGLMDFICPMNYWLSPSEYGEITQRQVTRIGGKMPIYSGLLTSHDYPGPRGSLQEYLTAAERSGAAGVCFFAYHTWLE